MRLVSTGVHCHSRSSHLQIPAYSDSMEKLTILFTLFALAASALGAESVRFITDEAEIPARKGKGAKFKIVSILDSGTEVQLLESDEDGFSRIRIPDGRDAWVPTRLLLDSPIAKVQLESLREDYDKLVDASGDFPGTIEALESERDTLAERVSGLTRDYQALTQEMASLRERAADPLQIVERNRQLREELKAGRSVSNALRSEIEVLQHDTRRDWFLAGAAVALGNLLLGLVIPRIPWRRRKGWSEY
jgi:SH3 domain protein